MFILENELQNYSLFSNRPVYVSINGILVPIVKLPEYLQQYSHNLFFLHVKDDNSGLDENSCYPGFGGSVAGLAYKNRMFGVCTAHQIWDEKGGNSISCVYLGFKERAGMGYIGPDSLSYYGLSAPARHSGLDEYDVCAFDFTSQVSNNSRFSHTFYNLTEDRFLNFHDDVILYLLCGYPHSHRSLDIEHFDDLSIKKVSAVTRWVQVWCKPIYEDLHAPIAICRQLNDSNYDPVGISGSPVFAIVLENFQLLVKFAGIAIQSNAWQKKNRIVKFVKFKIIKDLLN